MPIVQNTSLAPEVKPDFHILRILAIEEVEDPSYDDPNVLEPRLKVLLRVETPNHEPVSFHVWMSPKTSEKSTFGAILAAVLGGPLRAPEINTDEILGRVFGSMATVSDRGWPRLVSGTAAPAPSEPTV
jgi:hypothetical protein